MIELAIQLIERVCLLSRSSVLAAKAEYGTDRKGRFGAENGEPRSVNPTTDLVLVAVTTRIAFSATMDTHNCYKRWSYHAAFLELWLDDDAYLANKGLMDSGVKTASRMPKRTDYMMDEFQHPGSFYQQSAIP